MKIAWHNSPYKKAKYVLVGVPDETGNKSYRKSTSLAPN